MNLIENEYASVEVQSVGPLDVNCYFIFIKESSRLYIIDSGSDAAVIINKAGQYNASEINLLQTHCHVDHISALGEVTKQLKINALYINEDDLTLYYSPDNHIMPYMSVAKDLPEPDKNYIPEDCEVISTPGHTPGGVCFYFRELNALFSGDTLFRRSIGRTDLNGGHHETLIKSIREKLSTLPDTTLVFPGHGESTTIEDEKKHNPYVGIAE